MRCLIFLDVDGVLNGHEQHPNGYCGIKTECVYQLNRIIAETGAVLVISSAWRYMLRTAMSVDGFCYMLMTYGLIRDAHIEGVTPWDEDIEGRGRQIRAWMNEYGDGRRYVVLDDMDLGITEERHPFIQTDGLVGLTEKDADAAIAILKGA